VTSSTVSLLFLSLPRPVVVFPRSLPPIDKQRHTRHKKEACLLSTPEPHCISPSRHCASCRWRLFRHRPTCTASTVRPLISTTQCPIFSQKERMLPLLKSLGRRPTTNSSLSWWDSLLQVKLLCVGSFLSACVGDVWHLSHTLYETPRPYTHASPTNTFFQARPIFPNAFVVSYHSFTTFPPKSSTWEITAVNSVARKCQRVFTIPPMCWDNKVGCGPVMRPWRIYWSI
jgi:hypothetical protein